MGCVAFGAVQVKGNDVEYWAHAFVEYGLRGVRISSKPFDDPCLPPLLSENECRMLEVFIDTEAHRLSRRIFDARQVYESLELAGFYWSETDYKRQYVVEAHARHVAAYVLSETVADGVKDVLDIRWPQPQLISYLRQSYPFVRVDSESEETETFACPDEADRTRAIRLILRIACLRPDLYPSP